MAMYEVTIDFEPMVVQIEVDDDGEFSIEKIAEAACKLDADGQVYHEQWWVGFVSDEHGEEVYAV